MPRIVLLSLLVAAFGCATRAPAPHHHGSAHTTTRPPLFDTLGTHHHPITTRSPDAQRYFDQGLVLAYGFNHDEAIRAFREAARLDPEAAMPHWGVALALGPNYNLPIDAEREALAYEAIGAAQRLAPAATPQEQAYIAALATRYRMPSPPGRQALDRAYADAMRDVARRYPDDPDAATLFAEALMVLRPWDLWSLDGKPRPDTPEILRTLEGVLARHPNHPGANHFYVHAIEASPHPERGLAAADRLRTLVPGAGHLVHMPAHIYIRTGRYADSSEANRRAAAVDEAYIAEQQPTGAYPMMYYPHNLHFLWESAALEGNEAVALEAAGKLSALIDAPTMTAMPMVELFQPSRVLAHARFARWAAVLRTDAPGESFAFAQAMWRMARGIALAETGQFTEAKVERDALARAAAAIPADRIVGDNQPAERHVALGVKVLEGRLAAAEGRIRDAESLLREAIAIEDQLPYTEPPAWYHSTRLVLGRVLLRAGRARDAERVFRDDLTRNPENGWALGGLHRALLARRSPEAAAIHRRFTKAWANGTVAAID